VKISYPIPLFQIAFSLSCEKCKEPSPVYHFQIFGNGKVEYFGTDNVKVKGLQSSQIDQKDVLQLFQTMMEYGILEMKNNYNIKEVYKIESDKIDCFFENTDNLPTTVLEIHLGKAEKKIYNTQGAPQRLIDFQNLLIELSGANKWI
jgi:hypothetical protein